MYGTYCFSEDALKVNSPLDITGTIAAADAAMLRACARMLARFVGNAEAVVVGAPELTAAVVAAGGAGGGANGWATGVCPGWGVAGSRPRLRNAPSRAMGSGVAGFAGSALGTVGDCSAGTVEGGACAVGVGAGCGVADCRLSRAARAPLPSNASRETDAGGAEAGGAGATGCGGCCCCMGAWNGVAGIDGV